MIARVWKCKCPAEKVDDFIPYLHRTGVYDAVNSEGFRGAQTLKRELNGNFEVVLITFWESMDSAKVFAGEDIDKAVLYEEDYKYGIEPDLTVEHFTVADIYLK
ncbi:MAG TPA: antibiotic biosynthesis monooxygenase [Spirochaetota bacterium]|nr:antibiotic biosynthesis monooxygenase [Spirochaetota bacterium]HPJ35558.1 antibiotic biosynthesis monooxygenase [Spirochaetota bacterium]